MGSTTVTGIIRTSLSTMASSPTWDGAPRALQPITRSPGRAAKQSVMSRPSASTRKPRKTPRTKKQTWFCTSPASSKS